MELGEINLKLRNWGKLPQVETGEDPQSGESWEVRSLGDGLYIKLYSYKDSYGGSEFVGMEFVRQKEVTVTKFETI